MRHFEIRTEAISVEDVIGRVVDSSVGAVTTFVGVVRGSTGARAVCCLDYEAYPEMAEGSLHQIGEEIHQRWPSIGQVAIVHRVGRLEVGQISVVIALAAAHRHDTFDALHYAIDRLKEIVPIWKKEIWMDGEEWKSETPNRPC